MKPKPTTVANTNTTSRIAAHRDQPLHQADVGDGARHHVADRELREEPRPLTLQLGVQPRAQIECHVEADATHQMRA